MKKSRVGNCPSKSTQETMCLNLIIWMLQLPCSSKNTFLLGRKQFVIVQQGYWKKTDRFYTLKRFGASTAYSTMHVGS